MYKMIVRRILRRLSDEDLQFISKNLYPRQRQYLKEALECPKRTMT